MLSESGWVFILNVTSVVFPAYCIHFPFIVVSQYTLSSNQFLNPEKALKSNLAVGVCASRSLGLLHSWKELPFH